MNNKQKFLAEFSYLREKPKQKMTYSDFEFDHIPYEDYIVYLTDLYEKYLPTKDNLTTDQKNVLNDIQKSLYYIDKALIPFRANNIPYNLGVTGGAVYDLVTNNAHLTKDIDVVVNFNIYDSSHSVKDATISQMFSHSIDNLMKQYFPHRVNSKEEYTLLDIQSVFNQFIQQSFNNYTNNQNTEEKTYYNQQLISVSKLTHKNCNKPIDLILSLGTIKSYTDSFDFDICKNYIHYRTHNSVLGENFKPEDLLTQLYLTPAALKDMENKTLTMLVSSFDEDTIHFFMKNHFPRLKEKLPDFKLKFRAYTEDNQDIATFYMLNEQVAQKNPIKKKKI